MLKVSMTSRERFLIFPFFASGFCALIYQVCWQRLLFGNFGVDLESITIIVSTFMFGLGIGSILGGKISDQVTKKLFCFALVEFGIGLFGIFSPTLIQFAGDEFVGANRIAMIAINFLILAIPTVLMGGTLPVLVAYLFESNPNVGVSVGHLYCFNTAGAALGCVAGLVIFNFLSLSQTVYVAAVLNFLIAAVTWFASRNDK
jgi:predicted membrane-bound spermidine synthase